MTPDSDAVASTPSKTHAGRFWFESGLVFLVLLVASGDPPPGVNEAHYLCRLKHYWSTDGYCPGDLFLESPDAHFTVVWLFGWVTQLVSLEATAWIGRTLSWALLAVGFRRLVGKITTVTLLAPLGMALVLYGIRELHFAGEWVAKGFEAKSVAYGFVLLALADAIDGRWNRAWLGLGAASALHALVGGWSVVALAAASMIGIPRPPVRQMLPGLFGGGLLALAGVVPALLLNVGTPAEVTSQANEIYVYFRLPHHLAPLTKPGDWLITRAGSHAVVLLILGCLAAFRVSADRPALRLLTRFAWAAEGISLAGLAISLVGWDDHAWSASLLRYYWHRLADVAAPLAVAAVVIEWIGSGLRARRVVALIASAVLVAAAGVYLGNATIERLERLAAAGDASMADPAAWVEMCAWVNENTPPDAVFLVPRGSLTFKWRAKRAEVATYKDIPQDAASMVVWRERLGDVFQTGEWSNGSPRWARSLSQLGAARLRELGERYGATYALNQTPRRDLDRPQGDRLSLPVVHRVGPYTLYAL